jgi:hypothetical protein
VLQVLQAQLQQLLLPVKLVKSLRQAEHLLFQLA